MREETLGRAYRMLTTLPPSTSFDFQLTSSTYSTFSRTLLSRSHCRDNPVKSLIPIGMKSMNFEYTAPTRKLQHRLRFKMERVRVAPQCARTIYAVTFAVRPEKLMIVCLSCESHSSAIAITSISTELKSTLFKLVCKVSNMLTCKIRNSSMIIVIE